MNFMQIVTWVLRAALALLLLNAGAKKLIDAPEMSLLFEQIGMGKWFQYFTSATELLAAVLLLLPVAGFWGATLAAVTMFGAGITNLVVPGIEHSAARAAVSVVLFAVAAFIAWQLRPAGLRKPNQT